MAITPDYGKCPCSGQYENRSVEVRMTVNDKRIVLDDIPQGACPVCGSRVYKAEQLFVRTLLRQNAISEIGTIEAGDVTFRLAQTKLFEDVAPHAWSGSRGQRHHRRFRKQFAQLHKLAIFRSKVMSPLADAMRFVNRDLIDLPGFQIRQKAGEHQTLRCDIQ